MELFDVKRGQTSAILHSSSRNLSGLDLGGVGFYAWVKDNRGEA